MKSSLCNYSVAYILVKQTLIVVGARATEEARRAERIIRELINKQYLKIVHCLLAA